MTRKKSRKRRGQKMPRRAALAELSAEYDSKLSAAFNDPAFGQKVEAIVDARGRSKRRPKAGSF
jgi:ribosome assembly protein YihI (activator of Der GTPase)